LFVQAGSSWGRWPRHEQRLVTLTNRFDDLPNSPPMLPFGNGRSYGDVCLNDGGTLLLTRGLDRFISFDPVSGVLECEAGILLSEIIELTLPNGWFPAVTPGTALITVGGAIANDVHGKNHHRVGSFGHHVVEFELQRSDGLVLRCSRDCNRDWFCATIGGLGLTGLIRKARLQLRRVPGVWIAGDSQRFASLEAFFELAERSDAEYEYTVAWLDCATARSPLGRGVFMRGNHVRHDAAAPRPKPPRALRFTPPVSPINAFTVRLFNELYFRRPAAQAPAALWHYQPFLFPLDGLLEWNRIYGRRGFYQYQCVLPGAVVDEVGTLQEMLRRVAGSGLGSFLAVLKRFGDMPSLGLLSFPRPGTTLALDFPNRGETTLRLLEDLDTITRAAGGAVYPAKDARMSALSFQHFFPQWQQLRPFIDPNFSSSFWRRVIASTT
jgi:FAD/FMN-containing dehydrogenase